MLRLMMCLAALLAWLPNANAAGTGKAKAAEEAGIPATSERLLMGLPDGWKLGFKGANKGYILLEYIPAGETVQNWTSLIAVQAFYKLGGKDPKLMINAVAQAAKKYCSKVYYTHPLHEVENGYSTEVITQFCANNTKTGKGEIASYKIIAGKDRMYLIRKAWRVPPMAGKQAVRDNIERVRPDMRYLARIRLCDLHDAGHACPADMGDKGVKGGARK
ncbi:MAG: hypothetical protein P8076_01850 [Gammaproteobacteria bacterium]